MLIEMPALLLNTIFVQALGISTGIRSCILAVLTEIIYHSIICIGGCYSLNTGEHITLVIEAVEIAINNLPYATPAATVVISRSVIITCTGLSSNPCSGKNSTVFSKGIEYVGIILISAYCRRLCRIAEVIPLTVDFLPSGRDQTELGITVYTRLGIVEDTGILCLCVIDTIVTEVIIVSVYLVYTCQLFAILIVRKAAIFNSPAFLYIIYKSIAILEGRVSISEVRAGLTGKIGIDEGLKSVDFLILGLLREGVERICSEVCRISECTGVNNAKTLTVTPICIILGSKLNTCYHAKRICTSGIDRLSLVDPIKLKSQGVGFLIKINGGQREVLVKNIELADIYYEIVIKVYNRSNLCKHAYTLCKLKEEVPRACICHICAGKHINKIGKLSRNSNLSHVYSKDVGRSHAFIKVDRSISDIVDCLSIENLTQPSELSVTAGRHAKVEGVFSLLVHIESYGATNALIHHKTSCDLNNLYSGRLVTYEYVAADRTNLVIFKNELNVTVINSNRLVVITCSHRECCIRSVNRIHMCLGKVNVLGNNNTHLGHADDIVTELHINVYSTVSETCKYAVLGNSSKALIGYGPCVSLRKICLITRGADTLTTHLHGCADGSILIFTLNHRMIEICGAGSGRNHHKRGSYRTLESVRRSVYNAELVIAGLSCNVGGRSATVKVYSVYATCLKHDLCDLFHTTATGEGLLTAIEYHKYYLTGSGDTHRCTACAAVSVVCILLYANLAVFNKDISKACDSLLYSSLINSVVLLGGTDNSCAVIKDTEESATVNRVILDAAHYKHTAGLTGRHIKACTVCGCNNLIVGNVILAIGIAVLILSRVSLIEYALHFPTRSGIVVIIVSVYTYVISCDICGCNVVNHLLTVSGSGVMYRLCDTGSELSIAGIKVCIVGVLVICNVVTRERAYVICKCITNCRSQGVEIISAGEVSGTLESSKKLVGEVYRINSISHLCASAVGVKSVSHEVCRAILIGKILGHIVHEDIGEGVEAVLNAVINGRENIHNVICIKVTVKVELVKAGKSLIGSILKEVLISDNLNHFLEATVYTVICHNLKKVNKVTCPTAYVSVVKASIIVIRDIHCAEYVTDVCLLSVRKLEVGEVLKTGNSKIIAVGNLCVKSIFHIGYEFSKICILITCHNTPRTAIVALYAGTNVLDNKSYRILCGIKLNVRSRHFLKESEVVYEVCIISNFCYAKSGTNHNVGSVSAFLTALILIITVFCTGRSFCREMNPNVSVINKFLSNKNYVTNATVSTRGKTGIVAGRCYSAVDNHTVSVCGNYSLRCQSLLATLTIRAV